MNCCEQLFVGGERRNHQLSETIRPRKWRRRMDVVQICKKEFVIPT